MLPTPPSSPPTTHNFIPTRISSVPPNLPTPPSKSDSPPQVSSKCNALAEYYWQRHFEQNSVDPASFIERLMTDYAEYKCNEYEDIVSQWVDDMSLVYRIYKNCLNYGCHKGTRLKADQAKSYQGVESLNVEK
jgi:hypothetical protein